VGVNMSGCTSKTDDILGFYLFCSGEAKPEFCRRVGGAAYF
jgi:hypothetical protein